MQVAREQLRAGQQAFDLDLGTEHGAAGSGRQAPGAPGAVVVGTASQVLWDVLEAAYLRLGFGAVADEAFKALVLARIIEPTSKVAASGAGRDRGAGAARYTSPPR